MDSRHTSTELISAFRKGEQFTSLAAMVVGILSLAGGYLCFRYGGHLYGSGTLPFALFGLIAIWFAFRILYRTIRTRKIISNQITQDHVDEYLRNTQAFSEEVTKTRNVSALLLVIAMIGLVASCVIDRMRGTTMGWLAIVIGCGLLSILAYYHVFRMEIHMHEVMRSRDAGNEN